mmetsp:Transcript_15002/g.26059  ORF Transcript_15002/g.26059 Transcript_15002/m.26059 type:complete len:92 (+) Transcript_15002:870-1145(+)
MYCSSEEPVGQKRFPLESVSAFQVWKTFDAVPEWLIQQSCVDRMLVHGSHRSVQNLAHERLLLEKAHKDRADKDRSEATIHKTEEDRENES